MVFIIYFIIGVLFAFIGASMARSRGRDTAIWAFICFLFPLIGVLVLAIAGDARTIRDYSSIPSSLQPVQNPFPLPTTVNNLVKNAASYDEKKWETLVEYDADISAAFNRISPYGKNYVDQLARDFMAIGDKSYLTSIADKIEAKAKADKEHSETMKDSVVESGEYWGVKWSRRGDGFTYGEFTDGIREFPTKAEFDTAVKAEWRKQNVKS